jgi:hypothetical protein
LLLAGVTVILGSVGGLLGSWLVAVYLLVADRFRTNVNEVFAAQHIEGYNNFLRMHLAVDGSLTIFPVNIENVVRWEVAPEGDPYAPWFAPKKDPPAPRLIEPPIRFEPLGQ